MALTYDLKNDIRFKQGKEQGKEKKATAGVKNLLSLSLSHQQIADALEVSLEFVEKIVEDKKTDSNTYI